MFESNNTVRKSWPDYGLHFFARKFLAGETHTFPTQVAEVGESPNITILPVGLIRTWNENRASHLDVPGRPGRIYGGLLLPGQYVIEALEDTIYVCLAVADKSSLVSNGVPMFKLENKTLTPDNPATASYQDGYRAVICMYGECLVDGHLLTAGNKYLILDGSVEVKSTAHCEIALYLQETDHASQ